MSGQRWTVEYHLSDLEDVLEAAPAPEERRAVLGTGHLAGSRFNERVSAEEILRRQGWLHVRTDRGSGDSHWRHPRAAGETSATIYSEDGHCTVWSETAHAATGVPLRRPLDPFGLYTWLDHRGDFGASHAELLKRGFKDLGSSPGPAPKVTAVPPAGLRLVSRRASEITAVTPEWVWHRWLPKGKLVIVEGDPGCGKSTLCNDLAARITVGAPMPDGTEGLGPADVVVLSAEDDPEDTIVWRLRAAGADLERVHLVEAITDERGELSPLVIPANVDLLLGKVKETGAVLVVVDVLASYFGSEVDAHKDADVRRALQPLVDMARATRATVILVRHLRKEGSAKAIYSGNGSIGIAGVARAVHHIGYHPDDESIRVLAPVKINTAARPGSLSFRLLEHDLLRCNFVEWGQEVSISADDLVTGSTAGSRRDECAQAIRELLPFLDVEATESIQMPSNDLMESLKELGFSHATVIRAIADEQLQKHQRPDPEKPGKLRWYRFRVRKVH